MYILFTLTDTDANFQLKDEAGANIGAAYVYALANYVIFGYNEGEQDIIIQPTGNNKESYPPVATFPRDRIVFINSQVDPLEDYTDPGQVEPEPDEPLA